MSKFLDLVNEFARSVSVTPTAPTGSLMSLFTKLCDTLQVDCEQTDGGLLIKIPANEESEENVNSEISRMAKQSTDPTVTGVEKNLSAQAVQAKNRRLPLDRDVLAMFNKMTDNLAKEIQRIKSTPAVK